MTRRAVLFSGSDQPLEIVAVPVREPRGAEILVRVTCCTLCRSDLHTHAGRRVEPTPCVLGHEVVGRVEAFGPDAPRADWAGTPAGVGSRVTWAVAVGCGDCFFCREDLPQKCERLFKYGHVATSRERPDSGGLADVLTLRPKTAWFVVPDEIPDRVAAPANCSTATAAAVLGAAGPVAGRSVVVHGAGVLGLTACAMARANGAKVVLAVDPSPLSRERAWRFGATQVAEPGESTPSQVAGLTFGRGADVVLELAGTAMSVESAIEVVRTGGVVVLVGTVTPTAAVPLDPERFVRRMITIRGVHNYHPRDLATALAFLAGPGQRFPFAELVDTEFPLTQVGEAFTVAHANPGIRIAVVPDAP